MALPYVYWEGNTFSLLSILMASLVGYPWVLCTPPWVERTKMTSLMGYFGSGAMTCAPVNFLSCEASSLAQCKPNSQGLGHGRDLTVKVLDMGGPAPLVKR